MRQRTMTPTVLARNDGRRPFVARPRLIEVRLVPCNLAANLVVQRSCVAAGAARTGFGGVQRERAMMRTARAAQPPHAAGAERHRGVRSRWHGLALVVILLTATGVAAGCAAPQAVITAAARLWPPGGSRAEALAAGSRALAAIALPAGTRRVSARPLPKPLQQLPFGGGTGYVGPYRAYRMSVPMPAAAQYLQAHLAAGLVSGGISRGSLVNGPTTMLWVTSDLQRPPAGIAELELYEDVVPGPAGSSLLLAQALVTWYPPRSAAEYLTAARFRLVRVTAVPERGASASVTTAERGFAIALAAALDRLPAVPGGLPHSCPPIVLTYRLVLVPAIPSQPAIVVDANGCQADAVTVGGRAQPSLQDTSNTVYRLAAAFLRESRGQVSQRLLRADLPVKSQAISGSSNRSLISRV
jgi:hypothetical protein